MTVDAVNTDIFDDDKITGIICVWFVGEKLERVRFNHPALEHAQNTRNADEPSLEATAEYKAVLDEMADAMNDPAEETPVSLSRKVSKGKNERRSQRPAILLAGELVLMDRRGPSAVAAEQPCWPQAPAACHRRQLPVCATGWSPLRAWQTCDHRHPDSLCIRTK